MAWADAAYVESVTGKTVTDGELASAQAIVDLYSNRTEAMSGDISERDRGWLAQAVAWQAAWMQSQPGMEARLSVTGVDQDGDRSTFVDERAVVLAPLAKKAIRNCSWKRSRTTHVMPRGWSLRKNFRILNPGEPYPEDWDTEEGWEPL